MRAKTTQGNLQGFSYQGKKETSLVPIFQMFKSNFRCAVCVLFPCANFSSDWLFLETAGGLDCNFALGFFRVMVFLF